MFPRGDLINEGFRKGCSGYGRNEGGRTMCEPIIDLDLWNCPVRLSDLERIGEEEEEGASDEEEEDELALPSFDPLPRVW